jgi:hypothetical protein
MKVQKILICLCFASLLTIGGKAFAANTFLGDCSLVNGASFHENNSFFIIKEKRKDDEIKRSEIIDPQSLNIAFLHLKKNCCEEKNFNESNTESCK